jgi:tetratricopeptide (TPR) repeat protein
LNRNKTLLLASAVFLGILVFILTRLGLNNKTQVLEQSVNPDQTQTETLSHEHNHESPANIIFNWIHRGSDSLAKKEAIALALSEESQIADFEKLLAYCSPSDTILINYCNTEIALNSENWTDFDFHLKLFAVDNMGNDFVIQVIEPILNSAIEHVAKPLYYNLLSDVYLHDQNNTNRFMSGIKILQKVLELDSNDQEALYKLGIFSIRSNQLEKAKQRFKKLISLQPENEGYQKILEELCIQTNDSNCFDIAH